MRGAYWRVPDTGPEESIATVKTRQPVVHVISRVMSSPVNAISLPSGAHARHDSLNVCQFTDDGERGEYHIARHHRMEAQERQR